MNNRCGIYVRVSTEDQRDNGYSIDSQLRMIKEYCEKNTFLYNKMLKRGWDLYNNLILFLYFLLM